MSNKKEFSSTYKLDYKMHKEFSRSYLATIKSSSIILFLIAVALVINMIYGNYQNVMLFGVLFIIFILISKITGRSKIVYKRSKFLNNNEDIETTVNINEEKIIMVIIIGCMCCDISTDSQRNQGRNGRRLGIFL